ncbi:hypothetical protein O181_033877 [Austropuccinia psidii MF-1]|uniref:Uncharacterized protein n=1 Tax=Austropuccinia psidii MF-1 TaxID=1389203 RepID=A0A9Q3D5H9_9BASI|nr:hypothetical protein [Austropuccinia psidii MF-1]
MENLMSSFISKIKCIEDGSTLPPESGIIIAASPIPVSSNSAILSSCSSVIPLASSCIDNMPHLNQQSNDTPCLNLPTSSLDTSTSLYSISSHTNQSGN